MKKTETLICNQTHAHLILKDKIVLKRAYLVVSRFVGHIFVFSVKLLFSASISLRFEVGVYFIRCDGM